MAAVVAVAMTLVFSVVVVPILVQNTLLVMEGGGDGDSVDTEAVVMVIVSTRRRW